MTRYEWWRNKPPWWKRVYWKLPWVRRRQVAVYRAAMREIFKDNPDLQQMCADVRNGGERIDE